MGAAKNEAEVLEHMGIAFRMSGGLIGPASRSSWSSQKAEALEAVDQHLQDFERRRLASVLDVGVGDLTPLARWEPFALGRVRYVGVDGCADVLARARANYPQLDFVESTFGNLVDDEHAEKEGLPRPDYFDAVLLFDVLYHVPDEMLHARLLDWATQARYAVLLTYSTSPQTFTGKRPGESGFAWFPRPEVVGNWLGRMQARGWSEVYASDDFQAGPQKQRLVALVRD